VESRPGMRSILPVQGAEGATVTLAEPAAGAVAVGHTVLIGPSYGTRRSDFEAVLRYAAERLNFYTIADVQAGKHRSRRLAQEEIP